MAPTPTGADGSNNLLKPTPEQVTILWLIGGYMAGILILWQMPYLKHLLYPFKLVTIGLHEFGHACMACVSGGKVKSITVDPNLGGLTTYVGNRRTQCLALPAGYLGSSFLGAILVFCAFNVVASKGAAIMLILCLVLTIFWARNLLAFGVCLFFAGITGLLWWLDGGKYLKYFTLFLGILEILDMLVLRKSNGSDAEQFAEKYGIFPAQGWGFIWLIISLIFLVGAVLAGLAAFKDDGTGSSAGAGK
ncbi:hypothetical protein BGZ95_000909 [Linnemannia exigua]|uniref:Peptidase M50B-like-domain-containing protein n=1 Tax=Linnemannia exigua TaxID=604196 RepID=A0AAD4DJH1_9FUNG|nr:hypothetical protein BGZ95_000909 [Linnemannia exigua]